MRRSKTLLLLALLLVVLVLVPIFPTSAIFSWSASLYRFEDVHHATRLSEDDVDEIVELVADHPSFGSDSRYPSSISLKQYMFDFERFGFQGVGLMPIGFEDDCPDCSAAASASVERNPFDIASTMYFLAKDGEVWQIREVRDGVTGISVDDD